jgi:hypothetical protein
MYTVYPLQAYMTDQFLDHWFVKFWIDFAKGMWTRDEVEFRAFWGKVYMQLIGERMEKRGQLKTAAVLTLKKEIEEIDQKYQEKSDRDSVF